MGDTGSHGPAVAGVKTGYFARYSSECSEICLDMLIY